MSSENVVVQDNTTEKKKMIAAYILFALAIAYDISPVDIIPDVPVVGWIDDIIVTLSSGLNLIEKQLAKMNSSMELLVRYFKWAVIFLGIITVTLIAVGAFSIINTLLS